MKKVIILLALMILLGSCTVASTEVEDDWQASRADEIVTANSHFAYNILQELVTEEDTDNIFFSPLSLSLALSMTMNGASGTTLEQMKQTLHYGDLALEEINEQNLSLISNLLDIDPSVILGLANSIWIRNGYPVKEDFTRLNAEYYLSETFPDKPFNQETIDEANFWVSDNTGGRITNILKNFSADDVVFLINAIYLAADWKYQFDPEITTQDRFYTNSDEYVYVPFMNCDGIDFTYMNGGNFQAARLPYGNSDLAMYVILPEHGLELNDLIAEQNCTTFETWFSGYEVLTLEMQDNSSFSLPSFEVSFEKRYNNILENLGMPLAFARAADFSNMAYAPAHPSISYVQQNAWIKTDEQGSEATAATLVMMEDGIMPQECNIFNANRPFLYIIRDDRNGSVLFIGIMNDPTVEE
ncbi:MAG: serpin family protein [Candidatus Stygibacter australis]|nr:serpin family protein [Candidatus Stygibacter australis]